MKNKTIYPLAMLCIGMLSCKMEKKSTVAPLNEQITSIKSEFAPDKRVALFDVSAIKNTDRFILKGESNLPEAIAALKAKLSTQNVDFIDSIQVLPAAELGENTQGIIKISVANLRSKPGHSSELATQATLGTPVKVYKKHENWYYIQTPDNYLSWVDSGGIVLMDAEQEEKWKNADKIIYSETYGHSYSTPDAMSQVVSDMVAGGILEKTGEEKNFYQVKYPDGRVAFVLKEESQDYIKWLENLDPNIDDLVTTAKTLMGVPYLWGGTSTKGMDCSGFTKTIYFLNGMVIPRDASQQVHTGKPIDSTKNFENLERGDLLFFGRKATDSAAQKVVHVGMWIGNNEFIHASGEVKISSMDKAANNFDEYNLNRYLQSKRILKQKDEGLIHLANTPVFKD